jgi:nucleotide-binding universal stress UspA family protein
MSFKTIVIHLDDGPHCAARIGTAAALAARFRSRLVGIAATGVPDVIVSMNSAVPDPAECIARSAASLRERAEALARTFERHCAAARVASFESRVVVDEAVDAVIRHGRCSDLVVVGQRDRDAPIEGVAFDFPQQVLLHAGTPVLVVPQGGSGSTLGQRVVVAWKNKPEAARAVRDALPFLHTANRIVLCTVAEGEARIPADDGGDTVVSWLATHGIRVERQLEPRGDVGDRILTRAADCNADLIVSGGYGHSRLREWVLGGATRALLEYMPVPVLFSR